MSSEVSAARYTSEQLKWDLRERRAGRILNALFNIFVAVVVCCSAVAFKLYLLPAIGYYKSDSILSEHETIILADLGTRVLNPLLIILVSFALASYLIEIAVKYWLSKEPKSSIGALNNRDIDLQISESRYGDQVATVGPYSFKILASFERVLGVQNSLYLEVQGVSKELRGAISGGVIELPLDSFFDVGSIDPEWIKIHVESLLKTHTDYFEASHSQLSE